MNPWARALVVVAGAAVLTACEPDMDDLEGYARDVQERKSRAIDPIPQPQPYEPFVYEAGDRRDPFLPLLQSAEQQLVGGEGGGIRPDLNRPKEPLEEFSLDSLRMVGTITMRARSFALVKAPDEVVHRVTIGDHMGQNFGKITGISETEVVLMEIVPDGLGGYLQRPASLGLVE